MENIDGSGYGCLSFLALFGIWATMLNIRFRRFARSRHGIQESLYEHHFASDPELLEVALAVRAEIRDLLVDPDFVVYPDDDLQDTLDLCIDDIEDSSLKLLSQFGRTSIPQREEMAGWPATRTVEDWVRFIVRFRHEATDSGR
ncbi:MAG TPA: hypothetical protein VGM51_15450 [Armatimonadota bacterium]|jgi:hypothetical protein